MDSLSSQWGSDALFLSTDLLLARTCKLWPAEADLDLHTSRYRMGRLIVGVVVVRTVVSAPLLRRPGRTPGLSTLSPLRSEHCNKWLLGSGAQGLDCGHAIECCRWSAAESSTGDRRLGCRTVGATGRSRTEVLWPDVAED